MELSENDLLLVREWYDYARCEGAMSADIPEAHNLIDRIRLELEPVPEPPADVTVTFTQYEAELIIEMWGDDTPLDEMTEEEESLLRKIDRARKGLDTGL